MEITEEINKDKVKQIEESLEENKIKEIKKICESLKKNTMFNLSLSSKELFHSNFIAWLIENYPNNMNNIFNKVLDDEIYIKQENFRGVVEREAKNKDLIIHLNNNKIIVENKIKSVPSYKQLKKYSDDVENKYILLSLIKPDFFNDKNILKIEKENNNKKFSENYFWIYLSYEELLRYLEKEFQKIENVYIKEYIYFIKDLCKLTKFLKVDISSQIDFFSKGGIYEEMKKIRMQDIYHKIIYYQLKEILRKKFRDGENFYFNTYFQHNVAATGMEYPHLENADSEFLSFALKDNKLELFVNCKNLPKIYEDPIFKEKIESYFNILNIVNDKYELKSEVSPKEKQKQVILGFNQYNKKHFYRFIDIKPNLSVEDLLKIMTELVFHLKKYKIFLNEIIEYR